VQRATAQLGMKDVQTIRSNAEKESYGYSVQALADQNEASNDQIAARNARQAGRIGMATSLFRGAE
jgi:hypothetical protein